MPQYKILFDNGAEGTMQADTKVAATAILAQIYNREDDIKVTHIVDLDLLKWVQDNVPF